MQLNGNRNLWISLKRLIVTGISSALLFACTGDRPANLGVRNGLLELCPSSPNCVTSQAGRGEHPVPALVCRADPGTEFSRLKIILRNRSDTNIVEDSDSYLRVEFQTTFFVDDGEFLLDREQKLIHLRSASRIGYWDMGKNRSRMEEIRRSFLANGE